MQQGIESFYFMWKMDLMQNLHLIYPFAVTFSLMSASGVSCQVPFFSWRAYLLLLVFQTAFPRDDAMLLQSCSSQDLLSAFFCELSQSS